LDWIISRFVKKGITSLDVWVRHLLRLSIYQLVYLDRIPSHAAVFEAVQIAKKRGHKGISGFINGVLRSCLRQKETLLPKGSQSLNEKEIVYSHPSWFIQRMEEIYGVDETERMLMTNNTAPKISIRVNELRTTRSHWIGEWVIQTGGDAVPSSLCNEGVVILTGGNPALTSLYKEGMCTLQDESSMLVACVLNPQPGMSVLDCCAAPGGKTTHMAELMQNQGSVLACDVHPHKIKLIDENAKRLGTSIIETRVIDARELQAHTDRQFDCILLDAPCSGFGVIRRKPDIKWRKTNKEVDALVEIQKELLNSIGPLLKPGGTLVYSTCTTEVKENQEQIDSFLTNHPEFTRCSIHEFLPPIIKERAMIGEGWIQILPHYFDTDGFFIARLQKA
jgi:16S rRNA (cytosine967-C5)-methyltransferase